MGRRRVYANDAERQRAYRERKEKQRIKEIIISKKSQPQLHSEPTAYFFKEYTLEQVKRAYAEYKRINAKLGYDITRTGDLDYTGEQPLELDDKDLILDRESKIDFFEMQGYLDNIYFWTCYHCDIRNSVFEANCGKCHRKRDL